MEWVALVELGTEWVALEDTAKAVMEDPDTDRWVTVVPMDTVRMVLAVTAKAVMEEDLAVMAYRGTTQRDLQWGTVMDLATAYRDTIQRVARILTTDKVVTEGDLHTDRQATVKAVNKEVIEDLDMDRLVTVKVVNKGDLHTDRLATIQVVNKEIMEDLDTARLVTANKADTEEDQDTAK